MFYLEETKKEKKITNPSYQAINEQPISDTLKLFKSVTNPKGADRVSSILIYPKEDKIMATTGTFAVISKIPDTMNLAPDVSMVARIPSNKITALQRSGDKNISVSIAKTKVDV